MCIKAAITHKSHDLFYVIWETNHTAHDRNTLSWSGSHLRRKLKFRFHNHSETVTRRAWTRVHLLGYVSVPGATWTHKIEVRMLVAHRNSFLHLHKRTLKLSEGINALRRRTLSNTRSLVATFVLFTSVLRVQLRPTSYNMSSIGRSGCPLRIQAREIINSVAKYV